MNVIAVLGQAPEAVLKDLREQGFNLVFANSESDLLDIIASNARLGGVLVDHPSDVLMSCIYELNDMLPVLNFADADNAADKATAYIDQLLPPFTKALLKYVASDKRTFCTPGHMGGTAFELSPAGSLFHDFFGPNIFKADVSVSMGELGSLLDHSGPHKEAEEYIAEAFNADRSYMVTNGTSTANKIVGMYSAPAGATIMVDRNCHKSLTHLMMMSDVVPLYFKPTRNAYGMLGGIPQSEFTRETIEQKIAETPNATWPVHAVVTNSTYDGLLYNTKFIKDTLDVKSIHFDSAWVPYTNFNAIYNGLCGMSGNAYEGKVFYETQSTHKLLAAFSQASMIHVKGDVNVETFNEAYMMHTSTSPNYAIVASTEMAAAMMKGTAGKRLVQKSIDRAIKFRKAIGEIFKDGFYTAWQPADVSETKCWALGKEENWHGFRDIDENHMHLDPIKVTLLTQGLNKDGTMAETGVPATLLSKFLDDHGVIAEKTGPYNILFLFSIGIDDAKANDLMNGLAAFELLYKENALVSDMLPNLYAAHPEFYEGMRIQTLAQGLHDIIKHHDLPSLMYSAFDVLPQLVMTPYQAFQKELRHETEEIYLEDMIGRVSANMILPYPPGVPLVLPGEMITEESKAVLDFLQMLCEMGAHFPGFETDIHGAYPQADGRYKVNVIKA